MNTRERVLALLLARPECYLSGEAIAAELGVSRAAVWKEIRHLRESGYTIDAVSNRGYCLTDGGDLLSAADITRRLTPQAASALQLTVVREVDSTNLQLRQQANVLAPAGTVLVAGTQTAGRGRLGRTFYSPADTGLYLSVLLRPTCPVEQAPAITTVAAVAVCEAIEACTDAAAGIKWVNDVFVGGKKVCGILTEASVNLESGKLDYAVLGIGINACTPPEGFPPALTEIAGALCTHPTPGFRSRLCAEILNRLHTAYPPDDNHYVAAYRRRSIVIGKRITVHRGSTAVPATALDITDTCGLLVRYDDGRTEELSSGEISVRLNEKENPKC